MMLIIVDSSALQCERLRAFLKASQRNIAVLTDYAAMEAYKGDSPSSIHKSMEIVAETPKQVVILKGTQTVCGLRGRKAGLQRRLIDREQTAGFAKFCQSLDRARKGDVGIQKQVMEYATAAKEHIGRMLVDAKELPEAFDLIAQNYSAEELSALRSGFKFSDEMIDRLMRDVLLISRKLFADHPRTTMLPTKHEVFNTFIFRFALCSYLVALRRISFGGAHKVRAEKLRNDLVDASFAAYSLFFDGLLTNDNRLEELAGYARILLPGSK